MSQIVNVPATKQGLVYEDHHYKIDGRYERSPPSKLKGMYDYLPTEMVCRTRHTTSSNSIARVE